MTKIKEETFGLISAALVLGFANPDELLWLVATEAKPLGRLPYIPNHGNPKLIRFTMKQVQFIKLNLWILRKLVSFCKTGVFLLRNWVAPLQRGDPFIRSYWMKHHEFTKQAIDDYVPCSGVLYRQRGL